jgi:hypothetical protein
LADGEWHWRLASLDEAGRAHLWSPHRAFRVQPLPGAPAGGEARADGGSAHFSWSTAKGAARYGVQVGGDADLKDPVLTRETDKTAISEALKPGKYYWRARGLEADGQAGAWSPASPVILPPAAPVDLTARVEGDQLIAGWKGDAAAYRVELARSPQFTPLEVTQVVNQSGLTIAKPAPGEYWLRVVAIGVEGVDSPASVPLPISIKQDMPWWLPLCVIPLL